MSNVPVEELLEKQPKVKKIFEENAKKLGTRRPIGRKRSEYGLGIPYDGKKLRHGHQTEKNTPPAASYQKF